MKISLSLAPWFRFPDRDGADATTGTCFPLWGQELKLLKNLWDFKAMMLSVHGSWKSALWSEIQTDKLEDENRKLLKTLRANGNDNAVIKGWNVYRDIENSIKDMAVVLPLVADLHHPAMRARETAHNMRTTCAHRTFLLV